MPNTFSPSNLSIALIVLDGLIAGVESKSELPVTAGELKNLRVLINSIVKPVQPIESKIKGLTPDILILDDLQPALRAVAMPLFPTMNSLQQVVDLAHSQLPLMSTNAINSILFTYHNTMLCELNERSV